MNQITLVTGGCRSGKSNHARQCAGESDNDVVFIATCPRLDDEMALRIEKHREERRPLGWRTVEEELDLARAFASCDDGDTILVDCLTLWVNNLLHAARQQNNPLTEDDVEAACRALLKSCRDRSGRVVLVTNEVGLGVAPDNELARIYRDLVGRCNQVVAKEAERVILMVSGLPLALK